MTDNDQKPHDEEILNIDPDNVPADEASNEKAQAEPDEDNVTDFPQGEEPVDNDPVAALAEENAVLKDKLLRAMAEMENVRRRATRERDDAMKYGVTNMAKELLSVADNMTRAMDAAPDDLAEQSEQAANLITGIEATLAQLLKAFEKIGIRPVEAEAGKPFDPNVHEVMFEVETPEYNPGCIVQVMEGGYMIHDRLLRPARVGVVKKSKADANVDVEA